MTKKEYIKKLLETNNLVVGVKEIKLFESFINDESIEKAYNEIIRSFKFIKDKWMEERKIDKILSAQIVLQNGMVGKPYDFVLDFNKPPLNEIGEFDILVDEEIGIEFNKQESKISGTLKEQGEHIIVLKFKLKGQEDNKPYNKKEIKLIVNPDPKSLWVSKDSDNKDEYWKVDNISKSEIFGDKKLVLASKRGRSHAQEGKFRDDAFEFNFNKNTGWGIIAVADGAGSAKYSRKGSDIACKAIMEYFAAIKDEKLTEIETAVSEYLGDQSEENQKKLNGIFIEQLGNAAFMAYNKIEEEVPKKKAEMRDYSTTLIFALLKKYENKFVIASFWVGDGGIGIYNKETNQVFVLGIPDSGEFAGQTRFLTMSDIFRDGAYATRIRFKVVEDFTALILMTDGITDPKFQTDANLNRIDKWDELWADINGTETYQDNCKVDFTKPIEQVADDLEKWLDFWSPGNHDDRTIAILY